MAVTQIEIDAGIAAVTGHIPAITVRAILEAAERARWRPADNIGHHLAEAIRALVPCL